MRKLKPKKVNGKLAAGTTPQASSVVESAHGVELSPAAMSPPYPGQESSLSSDDPQASGIFFSHENAHKENGMKIEWEKWKGKVCGSPLEIKEALRSLNGKSPKDAAELEAIIIKQSQEKLVNDLKAAEERSRYSPY